MTPELQLRTLYVLDDRGRLESVRERGAPRPPLFTLVRGFAAIAWGIRSDVPEPIAAQLAPLLSDEPPVADLATEPKHAERYRAMGRVESGPALAFPQAIEAPDGVVVLDDVADVGTAHFPWLGEELRDRSPVRAVVGHGQVVSVCFCSRRSDDAAEAGVETAAGFRGRGYAPRVTAAWALAVRETGGIPLYSTSWDNAASRAVAAKLGLVAYAVDLSVYDEGTGFAAP